MSLRYKMLNQIFITNYKNEYNLEKINDKTNDAYFIGIVADIQ